MSSSNNQVIAIDSSIFSQNNSRFTNLITQFHQMCEVEFSKEELEPLDDWLQGLQLDDEHDEAERKISGPSNFLPEFYPVYIMMTTSSPNSQEDAEIIESVLGGVVLECYPRQRIFLMAYVVVSDKCRGQGVGRTLVESCKKWASHSFGAIFPPLICESSLDNFHNTWKPVLLIEVYQVKNVEKKKASDNETNNDNNSVLLLATANRQKVWSKLGFLPLKDVDLVHPGKLKGGTYSVAVMSCDDDTENADSEAGNNRSIISPSQLTSWFKLFFRLILEESVEDDEKSSDEDIDVEEQVREHFAKEIKLPSSTDYLEAGNEFWC